MTTGFKDHFSEQSAAYSVYRPSYPDELFSYLASLTEEKERAWDCATGNGQAAIALADYFSEVIGTDASANQISNALSRDNIIYKTENAGKTTISRRSVDLVTVAQALHWFNIDEFTQEVLRVLKKSGVLAVWTYGVLEITPELNKLIGKLYGTILEKYWPPERKAVEDGYKNVVMPLQEVQTPKFQMQTEWQLSQLAGYLRTWSAVKKYEAATGENPVDKLYGELSSLWGDPEQKLIIQWPLALRVWQNN